MRVEHPPSSWAPSANTEFEANSTASTAARSRSRTRRAPRPLPTRLESRCKTLAHRWTEHLESSHDVTNEIGEPVHGIASLDERPRAFLVQPTHPGRDGGRGDEHASGGLRHRQGPGGPQLHDGKPFGGRVVRPTLGGIEASGGIWDRTRGRLG